MLPHFHRCLINFKNEVLLLMMTDGDGSAVALPDFRLRSYQNEMVEESFHRNVIVAARKSYTLKTSEI